VCRAMSLCGVGVFSTMICVLMICVLMIRAMMTLERLKISRPSDSFSIRPSRVDVLVHSRTRELDAVRAAEKHECMSDRVSCHESLWCVCVWLGVWDRDLRCVMCHVHMMI
jgi:hypothetical protein